MSFGEKYASQDQTSFFSQTTSIFENSCLGPLNWNIHYWLKTLSRRKIVTALCNQALLSHHL